MGIIAETFAELVFENEASVSQNFLVPLLTNHLGYDRATEVVPERQYPAFEIPQNRTKRLPSRELQARPDYVLLVRGSVVAVLDSKGPDESLDAHFEQMLAYCIAIRTNLLLITNGRELRLYDANALIFKTENIAQLDVQFSELRLLLGREKVTATSLHQRLRLVDPDRTGVRGSRAIMAEHEERVAVALSDFLPYLAAVQQVASAALMLPTALSVRLV
ncbi:MAG TPA: hypothetical protein VFK05_12590, partial [Polyangiaceae bacterium]|nr:hypothetical protein [Polyangiaceae bacterium]